MKTSYARSDLKNTGPALRVLKKLARIGAISLSLAGCVVEPYPGPPPPAPVAVAPAPVYAAGPCCYAYPQYPPYYAYGPNVNIGFGYGGGGRRYWR